MLRTTFQLILASLAMTIAISYCTSLSRLLSDSLDPETGGLALVSLLAPYSMLSLFFSIFSGKWINTNLKMLLFTYFTAALMFRIVNSIKIVMLANFTELLIRLLGDFVFGLVMFFPLISLVAITAQGIIEVLNSLKKRN